MRLLTAGIVLILGTMMYQYFDCPLPSDMEEKWKLRVIDAIMRTYGNVVGILCIRGKGWSTNMPRKEIKIGRLNCVNFISLLGLYGFVSLDKD